MQENITLDEFDRRLLALLQADGRMTNQELADRVHLSASQCSRRRARLEDAGVIGSYAALLNRDLLGFELTVLVNITLNTHNRDNARKFADLTRRLPNVLDAYALTGEMDYQIKLVVQNLRELSRIINDELMPHEAVQTVKSSIVLGTIKESAELPLQTLPL